MGRRALVRHPKLSRRSWIPTISALPLYWNPPHILSPTCSEMCLDQHTYPPSPTRSGKFLYLFHIHNGIRESPALPYLSQTQVYIYEQRGAPALERSIALGHTKWKGWITLNWFHLCVICLKIIGQPTGDSDTYTLNVGCAFLCSQTVQIPVELVATFSSSTMPCIQNSLELSLTTCACDYFSSASWMPPAAFSLEPLTPPDPVPPPVSFTCTLSCREKYHKLSF